jgi:ATP-binding cassette subfamily C (CFTR/MRP) protein 4
MVGLLSENRRSLVYGLTDGMQLIADCFASLDRIEHFLLIEELASGSRKSSTKKDTSKEHKSKDEGNYIKAIDLTCHWNGLNETSVLSNINMNLSENKLALITGPVGCGKSTLLLTLLEELMPSSGEVQRKGSIVYVPQTAWVFSGSVKENILFSKPYDEKRYKETLEACDLAKDIERLPNGDDTTLGERGASLSGGQKARVNLARAVYADADIYLLDDPLSAVDAKVGKHIFESCISGMLGNKIRVLVTHQLQYLKNADYVMILDTKGTIEHEGDYFQLQVSYLI